MASVLILAFLASQMLTGCSAVEISPPIKSCKNYRQESSFGSFTIQQAQRGSALQWGAYPSAKYSGTYYIVDVYTGSKRYDSKTQTYAPHGSVNAATASKYSGLNLQISGRVQKLGNRGYYDVLVYNMVCKIL